METSANSREGAFQELLGLAKNSFLSYVVESSAPVVVDETDRKLLALFHELQEKERYYVARAYELLESAGLRPLPPTYPIKDSNFNFLRPLKLAEHWTKQVSFEVARLLAIKGRVASGDPSAAAFERLIDDFLALRREGVNRISEISAPAPKG